MHRYKVHVSLVSQAHLQHFHEIGTDLEKNNLIRETKNFVNVFSTIDAGCHLFSPHKAKDIKNDSFTFNISKLFLFVPKTK